MVICKFFLQGNCRFGENCKFEHQINDGRQQSFLVGQQSFAGTNASTPNTNIDVNTLIRAVANDTLSAERGGQWLLSCYAPFKEKPNFPGFDDKSFEEVRMGYYEAQHMGTINQFKEQFQMYLQTAAARMRALQNPSQEAINTIKSIYNSAPGSSHYSNASTFGGNQNSMFGNSNANNIFEQANTNMYGQNNQQQSSSAKSIFASANQKLFSGAQQQQNSIFANNQMSGPPNQNIFANMQQSNINFSAGGPFSQTFSNQNQSFSTMQSNQQVASPFSMQQPFSQQQAVIPSFNVQQQNGTLPFSNQQQMAGAPNIQQTGASPFGNQQQIAGTPFTTQQNALPFNQVQGNSPLTAVQQNTSSPFAAQTRNAPFATNQQQQQNVSPFGIQQSSNAMSFQTQPSSLFNNEVSNFGNNLQSATMQSVSAGSAQTGNIFGSYMNNLGPGVDSIAEENVYSKPEDLSENDVKSYANDNFEFGKIPEKPPTIQMCF